jgi:hypothetical protein
LICGVEQLPKLASDALELRREVLFCDPELFLLALQVVLPGLSVLLVAASLLVVREVLVDVVVEF